MIRQIYRQFTFRDLYYERMEEAVMGSQYPQWSIYEEVVVSSFHHTLKIWNHNVDDSICVIKNSFVDELLIHLNSLRLSIRFMLKMEKDGCIYPFLIPW